MVNASAALGILGGAIGGEGPSVSALPLFRQIRKNEVKFRQQFQDRSDVQKDIQNFKKQVGKLQSVEELVKDRRVLGVLLSAFQLESEISNPGKLKAIINSDPADVNSFANRLRDPRSTKLPSGLERR